jgi:hypothetical protein
MGFGIGSVMDWIFRLPLLLISGLFFLRLEDVAFNVSPRELRGDEEVQPRGSIFLFSVNSRVLVLEIGVRHDGGTSYPYLLLGTLFA